MGVVEHTKFMISVDRTHEFSVRGIEENGTVSAIQKLNPTLIKNVNLILTGWKIRVK